MDVIPPDMASDDLQTAIVSAQEDLARASNDPVLRDDPLRLVLSGLSAVIGVFGRSTRRWEKAVSDVIAARSPINDNDRAAITQAMEDGAYKAVKQEVRRLTRSIDWKQSRQIGLAVGVMPLVGLLVGIYGQRLLLTHPDISGMQCQDDRGGRVCFVWVTPPIQSAPQPPAAPPATPGKH